MRVFIKQQYQLAFLFTFDRFFVRYQWTERRRSGGRTTVFHFSLALSFFFCLIIPCSSAFGRVHSTSTIRQTEAFHFRPGDFEIALVKLPFHSNCMISRSYATAYLKKLRKTLRVKVFRFSTMSIILIATSGHDRVIECCWIIVFRPSEENLPLYDREKY